MSEDEERVWAVQVDEDSWLNRCEGFWKCGPYTVAHAFTHAEAKARGFEQLGERAKVVRHPMHPERSQAASVQPAFKIGDRVRVTNVCSNPAWVGMTGTVVRIELVSGRDTVYAKMDQKIDAIWVNNNVIHLFPDRFERIDDSPVRVESDAARRPGYRVNVASDGMFMTLSGERSFVVLPSPQVGARPGQTWRFRKRGAGEGPIVIQEQAQLGQEPVRIHVHRLGQTFDILDRVGDEYVIRLDDGRRTRIPVLFFGAEYVSGPKHLETPREKLARVVKLELETPPEGVTPLQWSRQLLRWAEDVRARAADAKSPTAANVRRLAAEARANPSSVPGLRVDGYGRLR